MSSKKIIVVIGATGLQGGSVARFLLNDNTFSVRAITRNPNSTAAKALASQGAQVIKADLRIPSSLEQAFEGAYGVFGLTNYWEPGVGGDGERLQGKALVNAAKSTGVRHFVWSTMEHTELKPDHWESKADVDDYLKASGVPRTSLYTTYYFENFVGVLPLAKRPDGAFDFPLPLPPDEPFPIYCADDTGAWVLEAFRNPQEWVGRDMRIAAQFLSVRNLAHIVTQVLGKSVHVQEVSSEQFATFRGNIISAEVHDNMVSLFNCKPPSRDPELAHELYPGLRTFRTWMEENAGKFGA